MAHLVETKRTLTDELPTGHVCISGRMNVRSVLHRRLRSLWPLNTDLKSGNRRQPSVMSWSYLPCPHSLTDQILFIPILQVLNTATDINAFLAPFYCCSTSLLDTTFLSAAVGSIYSPLAVAVCEFERPFQAMPRCNLPLFTVVSVVELGGFRFLTNHYSESSAVFSN